MSKARRLGVVLASLTLALVAVSPAWAATLHQTGPIAWTDAPQGSSADCAGALAQPAPNGTDVPAGSVLWRFTLVDNDPQNTPPNPNLTLTVQFTDSANNDQPITISAVDWVSYSDHTIYHFNVVVPDSYVLQGAATTGDYNPDTSTLNLSFVCGNPGQVVPEAPMSALLVLSAAFIGFFVIRRMATRERSALTPV